MIRIRGYECLDVIQVPHFSMSCRSSGLALAMGAVTVQWLLADFLKDGYSTPSPSPNVSPSIRNSIELRSRIPRVSRKG